MRHTPSPQPSPARQAAARPACLRRLDLIFASSECYSPKLIPIADVPSPLRWSVRVRNAVLLRVQTNRSPHALSRFLSNHHCVNRKHTIQPRKLQTIGSRRIESVADAEHCEIVAFAIDHQTTRPPAEYATKSATVRRPCGHAGSILEHRQRTIRFQMAPQSSVSATRHQRALSCHRLRFCLIHFEQRVHHPYS